MPTEVNGGSLGVNRSLGQNSPAAVVRKERYLFGK